MRKPNVDSSIGLEAAWEFVTPILEAWQREKVTQIPAYPAGSWGPSEANRLIEGAGAWSLDAWLARSKGADAGPVANFAAAD